jgi:hypothetical protein
MNESIWFFFLRGARALKHFTLGYNPLKAPDWTPVGNNIWAVHQTKNWRIVSKKWGSWVLDLRIPVIFRTLTSPVSFFQREHLDFQGILCVRDLQLPNIGWMLAPDECYPCLFNGPSHTSLLRDICPSHQAAFGIWDLHHSYLQRIAASRLVTLVQTSWASSQSSGARVELFANIRLSQRFSIVADG